jgi:hypothetical protein
MKRLVGFGLMGAAAFLFVGVGMSALAGSGGMYGKHGGGMFQRVDANKDGVIGSDEVKAAQAERFLRLDTDGDGVIAESEMLAAAQARVARNVAKKFARLDQNGDGRIEQAEFEAHGAARFARLDTDGDGLVSHDEIRAMRHGRRHGNHGDGSPNN